MPRLLSLMVQHPLQSLLFLYSFVTHSTLVLLKRLLLPHFPTYQSLRLQLQRAYLGAANVTFPEIVHRLPVGKVPEHRARRVEQGIAAYVIPGSKDLSNFASGPHYGRKCVALYSHGGGYARGEAKMYMNYMDRWVDLAARSGLELAFVSVEYPLSFEAPHPAQMECFLKTYRYLLDSGIHARDIVLMGDSAGGGLCVLSGIKMLELGLPQPACSVLISPWMDMETTSYVGGSPTAETDYLPNGEIAVPWMAAKFVGFLPPHSPEVNPLCCSPSSISGLNPQILLVGAAEFALYDSKKWAEALKLARVEHKLIIERGQLHIYAMGSAWVAPAVRSKTDSAILEWIQLHTR